MINSTTCESSATSVNYHFLSRKLNPSFNVHCIFLQMQLQMATGVVFILDCTPLAKQLRCWSRIGAAGEALPEGEGLALSAS